MTGLAAVSDVTVLWGDDRLIEGEPDCRTVSDAVYVPIRSEPNFAHDPEWGLYDAEGALVSGAAYRRGPGAQLVGQSARRAAGRAGLPVVDEELVYGGPMLLHYGHFVLASLARMWGARQPGGRRRVLWHADNGPELWFQFEHVRTIFGALGFGPEDFVRFEQPCVLRRVLVPEPCFEEQSFVRPAFAALGRAAGRELGLPGAGGTRAGRPVYVSKTRLPLGISRVNGEAAMEAELERRGFEIFHPTGMTLAAELQRLAGARAITGSVGSALHSTMFLPEPAEVVGLCPVNTVISNFPLVDRVTGSRAAYVYPVAASERHTGVPDFHVTWTLADPVGVARGIAERV